MREILFRAKQKHTKDWVFGGYYCDSSGTHIMDNALSIAQDVEVYSHTVGQYTGLTDKNGKKIFEGDILKTYTQTVQIIWSEHSYNLIALGDDKFLYRLGHGFSALQVIGNIHDNPELLEEESK